MQHSFRTSALMLALLAGLCTASLAADPEPAPQVGVRPELAKPIQDAQKALGEKNFKEALALSQSALRTPDLQPYEKSTLQRLVAAAAWSGQDYTTAAQALSYLSSDASLSEKERLGFMESQVSLYRRTKDYAHLIDSAARYLNAAGPGNLDVRTVYVQSLSIQGQHAQAIAYLESLSGHPQVPKLQEAELRVLAIAYKQMKNELGYHQAIKQLVTHYPSKDYWSDLLTSMLRRAPFDGRYELETYRLLWQADVLEEADDYIYLAQLSIKQGYPAEAARALALADKMLAENTPKDKLAGVQALKKSAAARAAEDDNAERQYQSRQSADDVAQLAGIYFSKAQHLQAAERLKQVLARPNPKREAELRLHLVISSLLSGQREQATAALAELKSDADARELGQLWLTLVK
jgi:hypothetical protein